MTKPLALVIEDDPQLSHIFSITLQEDFEVETITHGGDAIARLPDITPTIIVLDLNLPGSSGKDILTRVRADPRLTKTRVILATADDRQADMLRADVDFVFLKPISPGQLRELAGRLKDTR
jgi:DNA-binding response OmpR family regulator